MQGQVYAKQLFVILVCLMFLELTCTFTATSIFKTCKQCNVFTTSSRKSATRRNGNECISEIPVILDCNFPDDFIESKAWGKYPVLLRNAFSKEAMDLMNQQKEKEENDIVWPSWSEVMDLASDDEAESRLITHIPSKDDSWELELGPIENLQMNHEDRKWTVLVNDVDRFSPSLSEWICRRFDMIPQWRRDDAQISLSDLLGGIGSHCDDYDVFLIQMNGTRQWEVGKRKISSKEELEGLVPDIDVRILNFWDQEEGLNLTKKFILEPGDALYLPPRYGHKGTAVSDGCMTLSVGLRAPSAKEMMTRLSDDIVDSIEGKFMTRYQDPDLFDSQFDNRNCIDNVVRNQAKQLLRHAVEEILEDEDRFDSFFGKLVTESKRMRFDYPISLDTLNIDEKKDLGAWGDPETAIEAVKNGDGFLFTAEGLSWAYSILDCSDGKKLYRLFVDGKEKEIILDKNDMHTISCFKKMIDHRQIDKDFFEIEPSDVFIQLVQELVLEGVLYGCDAES